MKKIKIAFTSAFDESPERMFKSFNLLTPNNDGVWNNLVHVRDIYEADWIVASDYISPNLDLTRIDINKVIFMQREPPWFQQPRADNFGVKHKYGYSLGNCHLLSGWSFKSSYDEMKNLKRKKRHKKICVITTNKKLCRGHLQRLNFVKYFCKAYPGILDVYGNGMANEGLGEHYKGESVFSEDKTKLRWLEQYEYALCFENGQANGYFSEKIVDSFMAHTVPIYWGAPDIEDYFPEKSYHKIDISNPNSLAIVKDIISKPPSREIINNLKISRDKIMNQYNWWATVEKIIKSIEEDGHG